MGDKLKVLVCGHVAGRADALFARVNALSEKSGPFDLLLIAGDFFGPEGAKGADGAAPTIKCRVPACALGPRRAAHEGLYPEADGDEIAPDVALLGKRGLYTTSSGLRIAYLSGRRTDDAVSGRSAYSKADCAALRDACHRGQTEFKGVDVLITSEWPELEGAEKGSPEVSWLATHLRPRYHFVASSEAYYERAPYRNVDKQNGRQLATRLIGVAPVGNAAKQKWLYACSLRPLNKMRMTDLLQGTTDETDCPYKRELLYQHTPGGAARDIDTGQYFYDTNSSGDGGPKRRRRDDGRQERKRPQFDADKCWFCLSSPTVEKHLVICVGDHCYLALAKGPLTQFHCLILPIAHHQSYTQAPEQIKDEIKKFKISIANFYSLLGYVAVFFERNYKTSHLQIQCVPLPQALSSGLVDEIESIASGDRIEFRRLSVADDICDIVAPGVPYFHMSLPDGDQLFTKAGPNFPISIGRDILSSSSLLNCEEKADWKTCELSRDEEMSYVSNFRTKYEPFDFTQE